MTFIFPFEFMLLDAIFDYRETSKNVAIRNNRIKHLGAYFGERSDSGRVDPLLPGDTRSGPPMVYLIVA